MYLTNLAKECASYKVRVYLVAAQNLTATSVVVDLKSRLAGMSALCSAEPYSVIKVGDGENSADTGEIRLISGRENSQPGELNPKFF